VPRARLLSLALYSFAVAQLVSILGDRLHQFSVVGMIGRVAPGSSLELFQFAVFSHLPILIFAPLFGALIDRSNKAAMLVWVDVARGLVVMTIPTLFHASGSLYAFYGPVFVLATANLLFSPAKSAILPEVFGTHRLVQINAVLWAVGIVGTLVGFLAGGWLIDFHSWEASFYSDAASYLISAVFLIPLLLATRWTRRAEPPPPPEARRRVRWFTGVVDLGVAIREGLAILKSNRPVAYCLIVQSTLFGALGALYVLGVARIQSVFPPDKTIYLSLVACAGTVGLLAGAGLALLVRHRLAPERVIASATFALAVAWIGVADAHRLVPIMLWTAALGAAISPILVLTETLLQVHAPEEVRGRVFSAREAITRSAFLATSTAGAATAAVADKTIVLIAVGLLLAVAAVLLLRTKLLDA